MFGFSWGGFVVSGAALGMALAMATAGTAGRAASRFGDEGSRSDVQPDHHWLACEAGATLPRTVSVGAGVDPALVHSAMKEWNDAFGAVFVAAANSGRGADVEVVADSSTWVELPCSSTHSIVHVGGRTDLVYWLTHELGHSLGLADHIRVIDDASRYINPGRCPEDAYDGVMSYCTPRARWFGADDGEMMRTLFPQLAGPSAAGATSPLQLLARD